MTVTNFFAGALHSALQHSDSGPATLWVIVPEIRPDGVREIQRWRLDHAPLSMVHLLLTHQPIAGSSPQRVQAMDMAAAQGWVCRQLRRGASVDASLICLEASGGCLLMVAPPVVATEDWRERLCAGVLVRGEQDEAVFRDALAFIVHEWQLASRDVPTAPGPLPGVVGVAEQAATSERSPALAAPEWVPIPEPSAHLRLRVAHDVLARAQLVSLVTHMRNFEYTLRPAALQLPKDQTLAFGPLRLRARNEITVQALEPQAVKPLEKLLESRKESLREKSITTDLGRLLPVTMMAQWLKEDAALQAQCEDQQRALPQRDREGVANRLREGIRKLWLRLHGKDGPALTDTTLDDLVQAHWERVESKEPLVGATVDVRDTGEYQRYLLEPQGQMQAHLMQQRERVIVHLLANWARELRRAFLADELDRVEQLNAYNDALFGYVQEIRMRARRQRSFWESDFPGMADLQLLATRQMERMELWAKLPFETVLCEFAAWCLPGEDTLVRLAMLVRREAQGYFGDADQLCCMICSVALAAVLQAHGYEPHILKGEVVVDQPHPDFGVILAHHWVEVDGFWLDITADQFNPFLKAPMERVRVITVESDPRYTVGGQADRCLMDEIRHEDRFVQQVLALIPASA